MTSGFFNEPTQVNLETVNENWATTVSKIVNEIDSKGDALDSEVLTTPVYLEKVNENWLGAE